MERRSFTRIQLRSLAVVTNRFTEIKGATENLSLNGVRLKTAQRIDLDKGVRIRILFRTRSSELWVELFGVVIRHEDNGMVIQFTNMAVDSYAHLSSVISQRVHDRAKVFDEFFAHMTGGSAKGPSAAVEFEKLFNIKIDQQMVPL